MATPPNRYYVLTLQGEVGPYDLAQISQALAQAQIKSTDVVRTASGQSKGSVQQLLNTVSQTNLLAGGPTVATPAAGVRAGTTGTIRTPAAGGTKVGTGPIRTPASGSVRVGTGPIPGTEPIAPGGRPSDRQRTTSGRLRTPSGRTRYNTPAGGVRRRWRPPKWLVITGVSTISVVLVAGVAYLAFLDGGGTRPPATSAPTSSLPAPVRAPLPPVNPPTDLPKPPPGPAVRQPGNSGPPTAAPGRAIIVDGFDQVGPLSGQSGGVGWDGPWAGSGGVVVSGPLHSESRSSYVRFTTPTDGTWDPLTRRFAQPLTSGTWWLAIVMKSSLPKGAWCSGALGSAEPGGGWAFTFGGPEVGGGTWWASRQESDGTSLANLGVPSIANQTSALVVFRLDLGKDNAGFTMWINPPPGNEPGRERTASSEKSPPFTTDRIEFFGKEGTSMEFDDLRIGRSYAEVRAPLP